MIAYEITHDSPLTTAVLIQSISAGLPQEVEQLLERVDLNELFTTSEVCLLVRVNGDSMEDVPILNGDWVMLDRLRQPQPNDIIIAKVGSNFTIKRFKLNDNYGRQGLFLVPANNKYKSKKITYSDECEVVGVVTMIIHPTI